MKPARAHCATQTAGGDLAASPSHFAAHVADLSHVPNVRCQIPTSLSWINYVGVSQEGRLRRDAEDTRQLVHILHLAQLK